MFRHECRGGNPFGILRSSVSGATVAVALLLAGPAGTFARPLGEAIAGDPRVDSHLKHIVAWAEAAREDALGVRRAAQPAEGLPGRLPITVDYGRATGESLVHLILEGDVRRSDLESRGALVNTQAGGVTTLIAPLEALPSLLETPGLRHVSAAEAVHKMLDVSAPEVDADDVWEGQGVPPVYQGFTGSGVIVGIVDSGIDLNHADFRTAANQTRIKYAWDQTWTGTKPPGFTYGAEWTEAQINSGAASSLKDYDGHGAHVTGIAAGNGRATGNGQLPYQYIGIAPEADLVIVKTNFTDAGIIDGVNYVFQKATALGKPAVVNLSVGTQKGGHDGSHSLDTAISALTGPGRLVTAAAGNYGLLAVHDRIDLAPGGSQGFSFVVPTYTQSSTSPEYVTVEGWHEPQAAFQVKLRSPSGLESAWFDPGQSSGSITFADGTYSIDNDVVTNSRGAKQIKFSIWRNTSMSPHPAIGTWTLTATRKATATSGTSHFWISTWFLDTTGYPAFSSPDPAYSVSSPATADGVIATGAYATKNQWVNGNGGTSSYGSIPLGVVADFSSIGPRRDGVQRPDVVAPGYGVAAALSVNAPTSNSYKVLDRVHYMRLGTSQANAHTTGALALKLEEDPSLDPATAREALCMLARADEYTGATPNAAYGFGKLDVVNSSVAVGERGLLPLLRLGHPFPNPSLGPSAFEFSLGEEDIPAGETRAELRIFGPSGRRIATLGTRAAPGIQRLVWDGRTEDGHVAASGIYFGRLEVGNRVSEVRKLVRLER
jgi:subtilisin family serine protease